MKPIILALVPLLLLVSCTDTSDLEDRISQLEQQNTQLEKEASQLKRELETLQVTIDQVPDVITAVKLGCTVTKSGVSSTYDDSSLAGELICTGAIARGSDYLKRQGLILEKVWYQLTVRAFDGRTYDVEVDYAEQESPPEKGDTWPVEE